MQTLREIRRLLGEAGLSPQRRLGQNFLYDHNLLGKLLEAAGLAADETVLEVGAGTGSLTEELLARAAKVVAVEIDRGLCGILRDRLGDRKNLTLICGDVLAGKHAISPEVIEALAPAAVMVANLPYNVATPLVADCLIASWRACGRADGRGCRFDRLVFTVQEEVADRLAAEPGGADYGPVSVVVALLGRASLAQRLPASAFWPRPKVGGRVVRIDFDARGASRVEDIDVLESALRLSFGQRRKQIGSVVRRKDAAFSPAAFAAALAAAGIDRSLRAEQVAPERFCALANHLAANRAGPS